MGDYRLNENNPYYIASWVNRNLTLHGNCYISEEKYKIVKDMIDYEIEVKKAINIKGLILKRI